MFNTTNVIALLVICALLIPAVKSTIKHLRGEGECCGGPKEKPSKKKIKGKKLYTLEIDVSGMHCVNCKNRLEKKINETIKMAVCKVNLEKKKAYVSCFEEIDDALIIKTIEEAGYTPGECKRI